MVCSFLGLGLLSTYLPYSFIDTYRESCHTQKALRRPAALKPLEPQELKISPPGPQQYVESNGFRVQGAGFEMWFRIRLGLGFT